MNETEMEKKECRYGWIHNAEESDKVAFEMRTPAQKCRGAIIMDRLLCVGVREHYHFANWQKKAKRYIL
jgi:hypothetical protein